MSPRAFWAQRPLVCLALAYGAGILLGSLARGLSPFVPLTGILLGGLALVLCRKAQVLRAAACLIVFLFLGVLLGGLAAHPKLPAEGSYFVEGRVSGQSEYSEDGRRIKSLLSDVKLRDGAGAVLTLHRAYWTYYPEPGSALPLDGQRAMFTGQLYHPSGRANPYGFDFRAYLLQRGITAGISGARDLAFDPAVQTQPASPWLRARSAIAARLDLIFGPQHGLPPGRHRPHPGGVRAACQLHGGRPDAGAPALLPFPPRAAHHP